jgi:hypothetical protein
MVKKRGEPAQPALRLEGASRLRRFLEDTGQDVGLAEHGLPPFAADQEQTGVEGKKIVAVSTDPEFPSSLIRRALGVAGRLGTDIVGLSVAAPAEESGQAREAFLRRARRSAGDFAQEAKRLGVGFRHVVCFGRPAEVVEQECGRLRRVEFVLAAREQRVRDGFSVSMPLFEVAG